MVSFKDRFETDFGSTKKIKELTAQFEKVKPAEFKRIQKKMQRFKLKNKQL